MNERTEKRFSFLVNIVYLAVFAALFYLFVKYALPLVAPFIIAFILAAILQKPVNAINKKTKIPKGIAGTALVLLTVAVIVGIVMFAGVQVTDKVKDFFSFLSGKLQNIPEIITNVQNELLDVASKLPDSIAGPLTDSIKKFSVDSIMKSVTESSSQGAGGVFNLLKAPLSGALSAAKQVPSLIIATLITIISACFLTKDYNIIRDFIMKQWSEKTQEKISRTKRVVSYSISKIVKSYLLIILITATELTIGLGILKLANIYSSGYIITISILIAIIDIVPVLGTGTVLIPWAVISFINSDIGMGIGLIIVYAIITVIRQIIEPKLVAGQFDLPAIVTIASMYIGTKLFGGIGIFLLPLTVIVIKLLADEGIIGFIKTKKSMQKTEETEPQGTAEALQETEKTNEAPKAKE